jgi:hypothetical protein
MVRRNDLKNDTLKSNSDNLEQQKQIKIALPRIPITSPILNNSTDILKTLQRFDLLPNQIVATRNLNQSEMEMGKFIFGNSLSLDKVKVKVFRNSETTSQAFVSPSEPYTIYINEKATKGDTGNLLRVMMHELTHVHQFKYNYYQTLADSHNLDYLLARLSEKHRYNRYNVNFEINKPFRSYNIEQQAGLVESLTVIKQAQMLGQKEFNNPVGDGFLPIQEVINIYLEKTKSLRNRTN